MKTTTVMLATILLVSGIIPSFAETDKIIPASFVDPTKDPQHYLDRYYNEVTYKSWFDRNYPDYTIEEAVGVLDNKPIEEIIQQEILPEAEAELIVGTTAESKDVNIAQLALAVGGLGILFGAVLGIKRKVDDNSKQISINSHNIKQKLFNSFKSTKPIDILQLRLAKGEISLEEYSALKLKLNEIS